MSKRKGLLWATQVRQSALVNLFKRSSGFCVFGHRLCQVSSHHYEPFIDALVKDWQADDRASGLAMWQAEQRAIHCLGERGRTKGEFNAIAKDIFYASQPELYILGLGVSVLTYRPFAKVRLPSSYMNLHVDLGDTLRGASKNQRRKAIRYRKALPDAIQAKVDKLCHQATKHYHDNR